MSRRFHKKSKNGCLHCKRRHVKCDESRPSCVNCTTASLSCSYPPGLGLGSFADHHANHHSPAPPFPNLSAPSTPGSTNRTNGEPLAQYAANLDHLELLCHFITGAWKDLDSLRSISQSDLLQIALSSSYLMHEMLAISALHLSILYPDRQDFYCDYAAGFQTKALSLFNSTNINVDAENCVPVFLFSSFLGVHMLCATLRHRSDDLPTFLDAFARYLAVHRGVRAITNQWWPVIRSTPSLAAFIQPAESVRADRTTGSETAKLTAMVNSSKTSDAHIAAYELAIQHLQWAFDAERSNLDNRETVFAWPVLAPAEFADILAQQNPEALVILSYYAVLLHWHRDKWLIGDGGSFLIKSISWHLGEDWRKWLEWPNQEIAAANEGKPG